MKNVSDEEFKKLTLIIIMVLISIASVKAQDSLKYVKREWANGGIGISYPRVFNGLIGINLGLDYNHTLINNWYYQIGFNSSGSFLPADSSVNSLNFGIAKAMIDRYYLGAIFLGPAFMWGKNANKTYTTVGIVANIQLLVKPLKDFGIGIELFSMLNPQVSSTGVRAVLHLSNGK
jgi:hypothetical protein